MPSEESYKKVEGDWKDFRIRRILPSDHSAVFEHISETFSHDEPTSKLLGWSQDFADDLNRFIELFLAQGMSFLVEHKETGKIAGLRITFHHTPDNSSDSIPINSLQAKILLKFLDELEGRADVPKRYKTNSWAEFFIASTSRDFREQGICGELYNRSIEFLRSEGYRHALVIATSPYTRQATLNRGFEQASRMQYDQVTDLEGNPAFKKEDLNEDHFAVVMIKVL